MWLDQWINTHLMWGIDGNSEDDPDDLISMEKLDRNSPEVWPEKSE